MPVNPNKKWPTIQTKQNGRHSKLNKMAVNVNQGNMGPPVQTKQNDRQSKLNKMADYPQISPNYWDPLYQPVKKINRVIIKNKCENKV